MNNRRRHIPTVRVTSCLVFLDVTGLDRKVNPVVTGFSKDDFTITEDKKPQRIFPFEAPQVHTMGEAAGDIGTSDPYAGDVNFGVFVNETGGKLFFNNDVDAEIRRSQLLGSEYYTLTYQSNSGKALENGSVATARFWNLAPACKACGTCECIERFRHTFPQIKCPWTMIAVHHAAITV